MTETTTTNGPGFEQQATAKWIHKHNRPLLAGLAVALHDGEAKRISETMFPSSLAVLCCPLGTTSEARSRSVAFVRQKKVDGGEYYQLVESRRVDGKPRQKVLVHLGHHPTVDDALKRWPRDVGRLRRAGDEKSADTLKTKLERLRKLRAEGRA
jgi:hypothetical protein